MAPGDAAPDGRRAPWRLGSVGAGAVAEVGVPAVHEAPGAAPWARGPVGSIPEGRGMAAMASLSPRDLTPISAHP